MGDSTKKPTGVLCPIHLPNVGQLVLSIVEEAHTVPELVYVKVTSTLGPPAMDKTKARTSLLLKGY